jgi:predicted metal-dependent phosphotriesterase family hydrolase
MARGARINSKSNFCNDNYDDSESGSVGNTKREAIFWAGGAAVVEAGCRTLGRQATPLARIGRRAV